MVKLENYTLNCESDFFQLKENVFGIRKDLFCPSTYICAMRPIFYIDTSEAKSCYLLIVDGQIQSRRSDASQQDHSGNIHTHLESMLHETNLAWGDIKAVAVLNGPGSYTGLRISLASAKGICFAQDIPLILLNKLDLIFRAAPSQSAGFIMAIQRAREQEFFTAVFDSGGSLQAEPQLMQVTDIHSFIEQHNCTVVAEDAQYQLEFPQLQVVSVQEDHIFNLILENFQEKKWAELIHSEPFYMKNVFINKINKL